MAKFGTEIGQPFRSDSWLLFLPVHECRLVRCLLSMWTSLGYRQIPNQGAFDAFRRPLILRLGSSTYHALSLFLPANNKINYFKNVPIFRNFTIYLDNIVFISLCVGAQETLFYDKLVCSWIAFRLVVWIPCHCIVCSSFQCSACKKIQRFILCFSFLFESNLQWLAYFSPHSAIDLHTFTQGNEFFRHYMIWGERWKAIQHFHQFSHLKARENKNKWI